MATPKSTRHFVFSHELADDRQASVLYSPFREKSLNPLSWDRKMKFWENLLLKTFMEQRIISFDSSKLPEMFERNGLTPKCLSTVIEQMKRSGHVQPISQYQRSTGWLSWGFNTLVKQPVYWGVTQLIGSPKKNSDMFVCPDVVKAISSEVLQRYQSRVQFSVVDSLVSLVHFKESNQDLVPEDENFQIILTHLERENQIAISQTSSGDVIVKVRKEGESSVSFKETDLNVYSLQIAVEKLEKEIDALSSRVDRYLQEAKLHVKEGRKRKALMSLRRKASLLKLLGTKSGSLTMLHDIMHKIEEANTNEMVVRACEAGVQAMRTLNEGVTAERAESVMDDIQEAVDLQEEVNTILSSPISEADEEELERSLQELLREDGQQAVRDSDTGREPQPVDIPHESDDIAAALSALDIDDLGLPNVPSHSPSQSNTEHREKEAMSAASTVPAP